MRKFISIKRSCLQWVLSAATGLPILAGTIYSVNAWAQTTTGPVKSQLGTVKEVSGSSLTMTTNAGSQLLVTIPDGTRILQVAPGSTNLNAAQTITLTDIGVGDKILVSGQSGEAAGPFHAARIILMKSGDIAQKRAAEQADWQKRGMGGIINAVDRGTGTVTFTSGAKKIQVQTTGTTLFRRYAPGSIKFADALPGTIAQIQAGDQMQVRGAKSEDGTSIQAEEVVSGSFLHLSGTLTTIDPTAGTVSLKDLATGKVMAVAVTPNSDVRTLPPDIAARFAARQRGGATGEQAAAARPAAQQPASETSTGRQGDGMRRSAGMDLSKMLSRLPRASLADLHTGDAVMIVSSRPQPGSDVATAITLLDGVEPILAATPRGSEAMTLSPWSVGGNAPDGGDAPQ